MKKHYSDYVAGCARFYFNNSDIQFFHTEIDERKWNAVDTALKDFSERDITLLRYVYQSSRLLKTNECVINTAYKLNAPVEYIWIIIGKFEKKVAKRLDLI